MAPASGPGWWKSGWPRTANRVRARHDVRVHRVCELTIPQRPDAIDSSQRHSRDRRGAVQGARRLGTSHAVIGSSTRVTVQARLVDVKTGTELWSGDATAAQRTNNDANDLGEIFIGTIVNQVLASTMDPSQYVARQANASLLNTADRGLLARPLSSETFTRVTISQSGRNDLSNVVVTSRAGRFPPY